MTTAAIRQKLHNYLEVADDKKIKALYSMLEAEVEENHLQYTEEIKASLDQRFKDYHSEINTLTPEESEQKIQNLLTQKSK